MIIFHKNSIVGRPRIRNDLSYTWQGLFLDLFVTFEPIRHWLDIPDPQMEEELYWARRLMFTQDGSIPYNVAKPFGQRKAPTVNTMRRALCAQSKNDPSYWLDRVDRRENERRRAEREATEASAPELEDQDASRA